MVLSKMHHLWEHYWYQSYYIYIHAGIRVHKIPVHIIANPFHIFNSILYHAIYIIFFSALIPWCIWYQNCGKPYIPVTGWYHKVMSLGPRPYITMSLCPRWSSLPQEHSYSDLSMVSWFFEIVLPISFPPSQLHKCPSLAAPKALSLLICFVSWWQPLRGKGESEACKCPDQYECVCMYYVHCTHNTVCVCTRGWHSTNLHHNCAKKAYHSPSLPT